MMDDKRLEISKRQNSLNAFLEGIWRGVIKSDGRIIS